MPKYYPAKQIIPGLWIGSEGDSQDRSFFRQHNIGMIVNCSNTIPFKSTPGVEEYRVPIDDDPSNNGIILSHFPVVVRAIDAVLSRGKSVLVHCRAGMQRSASVVAAYLMFKHHMSARDAKRAIKDIKNETFWPVPTFDKALASYEKQLQAFHN